MKPGEMQRIRDAGLPPSESCGFIHSKGERCLLQNSDSDSDRNTFSITQVCVFIKGFYFCISRENFFAPLSWKCIFMIFLINSKDFLTQFAIEHNLPLSTICHWAQFHFTKQSWKMLNTFLISWESAWYRIPPSQRDSWWSGVLIGIESTIRKWWHRSSDELSEHSFGARTCPFYGNWRRLFIGKKWDETAISGKKMGKVGCFIGMRQQKSRLHQVCLSLIASSQRKRALH